MGVPREDLLLMLRALKRGYADIKAIRKALARQVSKPISFLDALHLSSSDVQSALKADQSAIDAAADRPLLDVVHTMLLEEEQITPADWEKFVASLTRPSQRHGYGPLPVPQEFDGYTLQWELARRERGVVYRAKGRDGREVAIKVFRKDVPITGDLPRVDGHAYAVSEFADGESLEAKRPAPRRAAQAIQKAAEILKNKPHGALSPARIVIRKDDSVAVLGYAYAKAVSLSSQALAFVGTSDVHALGAILYDALVASPPAAETSPAARVRGIDEGLDRIVSFALTGGYSGTGEMADDLGRYLRGEPVTARKAAAAAGASGKKKWLWAAAVLVPLAGAILTFAWPREKPAPGPEPVVHEEKPAPAPKAPAPRPRETAKPPLLKPAPPPKPLTAEDEQKLYDIVLDGKSDADRIIAAANEAIARGCKRDWPYYHLANVFIARNELDKALEYVNRALDLAPDNRDYLEMRAHTYAFRGEAKKAIADLDHLYGKKPADLNRQIVQLTRQAEADAKDAQPFVLRGVFYHLKRHYETAQRDFTEAIDRGHRRALAWRAFAFHGGDDRARAIADAKAYLQEFPADFATEEVKAFLKDLGN